MPANLRPSQRIAFLEKPLKPNYVQATFETYTCLAMRNVASAVETIPEPKIQTKEAMKATGTDGKMWRQGGARVTAQASARGRNCHFRDVQPTREVKRQKRKKPLQLQGLSEAEGTRLELATPCGAPHFQCGR
jgi:hypothetical protein